MMHDILGIVGDAIKKLVQETFRLNFSENLFI